MIIGISILILLNLFILLYTLNMIGGKKMLNKWMKSLNKYWEYVISDK